MQTTSNLLDYDAIGFDLDFTLLKYQLKNLTELVFKCQASFLVKEKGYDSSLEDWDFERDKHWIVKGITFDMKLGNLLLMNGAAEVRKASHGTKILSADSMKEMYPTGKPHFAADIVKKVDVSKDYRVLETYFDMPCILLMARMVDQLDARNTDQAKTGYLKVWKDILASLFHVFDHRNYATGKSPYFKEITTNVQNFTLVLSEEIVEYLRHLKSNGKILFLLTSAYCDCALFLLKHIFDKRDWSKLFDICVFLARKPGFFTEFRTFCAVDEDLLIEGDPINEPLKQHGYYSQGCVSSLHKFLSQLCNKPSPRVVYLGDSFRSDTIPVADSSPWDAWTVIEELQNSKEHQEELQTAEKRQKLSEDRGYAYQSQVWSSDIWGNSLKIPETNENTFWYSVVKSKSVAIIQQLDDLVE